MPKKLTYIFLLFLLFPLYCYTQYDGSLPYAKPVTPTMAALYKTAERPVGSFTGTTPITVPLYTIDAGKVKIPLSVNYHNGGIKVEEIAGNVGLGWSFSGNWNITRTVRGAPDDLPGIGFLHITTRPSHMNGSSGTLKVDSVLRNYIDVEPDIYYFNFNNHSGKFSFNEQKEIVIMNQLNIKIEPVWLNKAPYGNIIQGWIVTDEDGIKYYLGLNKLKTKSYLDRTLSDFVSLGFDNSRPYPIEYFSTWHMSEIFDMNDEKICTYSYDSTNTYTYNYSGGYYNLIAGYNLWQCKTSDFNSDNVYSEINAWEKMLKEIETNTERVVFYNSYGRQDAVNYRIDSIRINDINNNLLKRIRLNYNYFLSSGASTGFDANRKRLKLLNISSFGNVGTDSLTHRFDYVETTSLPPRNSPAVDYWGFYNGKTYNTSFFPNGSYSGYGNSVMVDNLGDRRSDPYYTPAATLRKITFPTGGYREFVYENNDALYDLVHSQVKPDARYYQTEYFDTSSFNTTNPWEPAYKRSFTINTAEEFSVFYYSLWGYGFGSFSVKIIRVLGPSSEYTVHEFFNQYNGNYSLPSGNYRLEFNYDYLYSTFDEIFCYWNQLNLNKTNSNFHGSYSANNMYVGGVRVKEIIDYDPIAAKSYKTKYKYKQFRDTTLTSGILISPVSVLHKNGCENRYCDYLRLSATSQFPLATEGGSYVVYPEVTTIEEGFGRREQTFSFRYDNESQWVNMYEFPVLPPQDFGFMRGKLLMEKIYDQNNLLLKKNITLYQLMNQIPAADWDYDFDQDVNLYDYLIKGTVTGWKVAGYYQVPMSCPGLPANLPCVFCGNHYYHESIIIAPRMTIESTYTPAGRQDIRTDYEYHYSAGRPQLKQTKTFLDDKIKLTNYRYAFNGNGDFLMGLTTPEQQMKDSLLKRNFLRPLEQTTYVLYGSTDYLLNGIKTAFSFFNTTDIQPSSVKNYTTSADYDEIVLAAYDTKGNILSKYAGNDVRESFIRGYNDTYIIASALNATPAEIIYAPLNEFCQEYKGLSSTNAFNITAATNAPVGTKALSMASQTGTINLALTLNSSDTYVLTYWENGCVLQVQQTAGGITVLSNEILKTKSSWNLRRVKFTGATTNLRFSFTPAGFVQEIRMHPADAHMETFNYKIGAGVTVKTDAALNTTFYEYDHHQRLRTIRDIDKYILGSYCYDYAAQQINCESGNAGVAALLLQDTQEPQQVPDRIENDYNTLYARLQYENLYTTWDATYADVTIQLYKDEAFMIPANDAAVTVEYEVMSVDPKGKWTYPYEWSFHSFITEGSNNTILLNQSVYINSLIYTGTLQRNIYSLVARKDYKVIY
ncbi:hypothetical protein [Gynurincola endophyticus]|uniref:hypothetical protein n=1 Tax=Gynurincola endophyticus TaxID=2479004 RepID=UPI000F8DCC2D|nr:hypothetical protein [Gynurincola endophyticus]